MTATPASATTTRLLCWVEAAPIYSDGTVLALGVAAIALLLRLVYVLVATLLLVATTVLEGRTMVDVAVAETTVIVIVVVETSDTVVACAKAEGARMTASVATAATKRILVRRD